MLVNTKPGTFADLNPGDVFIVGASLYMRAITDGKANAVNIETGIGEWFSTATQVAKVAAEIQIDY